MPKSYHDWTYNSKNPLRRYAHRSRFAKSISYINMSEKERLMDFGCGDGLFLNNLRQTYNIGSNSIIGFEPYMDEMEGNEISIVKNWTQIEDDITKNGFYDYVTAFEVFEHFNSERQAEALTRIKKSLKPGGCLIISVPVEKGFPSLVKTLMRRINHPHNKHLYNFKNAWRSFMGKSMPEYRSGNNYLSHLGFYFDDLSNLCLSNGWKIIEQQFSPFKKLGSNFNSQVFFKLQSVPN